MSEYLFKVIAIGDGGVGKTSITMRYVREKFDSEYKATIGVAHAVKRLVIEDMTICMVIWDTGGQEMFDFIRAHYYSGAHGGLIVYDVTKQESFDHLFQVFCIVFLLFLLSPLNKPVP